MIVRNGYIREDRRWQAHLARCERVRVRHRATTAAVDSRGAYQMSESVSSNGVSRLRPQALVWWGMGRGTPSRFPEVRWELCSAGGGGCEISSKQPRQLSWRC